MARKVLAPSLITGLIDLRNFFAHTIRLSNKTILQKLAKFVSESFTYAYHATYISVFIFFAVNVCSRLRLVVLGLDDLNALLFLCITLRQSDFLLGHNHAALVIVT